MMFGGSTTKQQAAIDESAPGEDLEAGQQMGSGSGRGPDGAGSYEMVGMGSGSGSREPA